MRRLVTRRLSTSNLTFSSRRSSRISSTSNNNNNSSSNNNNNSHRSSTIVVLAPMVTQSHTTSTSRTNTVNDSITPHQQLSTIDCIRLKDNPVLVYTNFIFHCIIMDLWLRFPSRYLSEFRPLIIRVMVNQCRSSAYFTIGLRITLLSFTGPSRPLLYSSSDLLRNPIRRIVP